MAEITQTETQDDPKLDDLRLPKDVKKVLTLLAEAQELPSSTRSEHIIKQHRLNQITSHLHIIQQGPESPVATAQNMQAVFAAQNAAAKEMLIESLGRQHPVIRELAEENAALKAGIADAVDTADIAALKEENESLKAEIKTLKSSKK